MPSDGIKPFGGCKGNLGHEVSLKSSVAGEIQGMISEFFLFLVLFFSKHQLHREDGGWEDLHGGRLETPLSQPLGIQSRSITSPLPIIRFNDKSCSFFSQNNRVTPNQSTSHERISICEAAWVI